MGNHPGTAGISGLAAAEAGEALRAFVSATQRTAYALALRITAEAATAEEAVAAGYAALKPPFSDRVLFDAVRSEALARAGRQTASSSPSYQLRAGARAAFESLPSLQRTALELVHTGGMTVASIAEVLQEEPAAVRTALREALLTLGALAPREGGAS